MAELIRQRRPVAKKTPEPAKHPKAVLQRGRITAGPLTVEIETDNAGRLRAVRLPVKIPDGLTTEHLSSVLTQLGRLELALGTSRPFHRSVWQRLRKIPWGSALTYGEIATALGSPRASRAVGQACASNLLLLIIPCHRVLAAQGLGGFAFGLAWKNKLLELETEPRPRAK